MGLSPRETLVSPAPKGIIDPRTGKPIGADDGFFTGINDELADKGWATVQATRGAFETKKQFITLNDGVTLALNGGYGGQLIAAHEGRDLAVAITSDPNQPARSDGHFGALMRLLDGPILNAA